MEHFVQRSPTKMVASRRAATEWNGTGRLLVVVAAQAHTGTRLVRELPSGADGCILHLAAWLTLQPLHDHCLVAVCPLRCVNGHSEIKECVRKRSSSRKRADAAAAPGPS